MPVGQPSPTPYPPVYQPIQPAAAQPVPQPIEPYTPEVGPVPVEEVSTKPLDPFFDALTYTDLPSPHGGAIPSYPSAQPPVIYGPAGLNFGPTPTHGPKVAPPPPVDSEDPTHYAREPSESSPLLRGLPEFESSPLLRELPDLESPTLLRELPDLEASPDPQSGPAMDYFDPMVEFLPEMRRYPY